MQLHSDSEDDVTSSGGGGRHAVTPGPSRNGGAQQAVQVQSARFRRRAPEPPRPEQLTDKEDTPSPTTYKSTATAVLKTSQPSAPRLGTKALHSGPQAVTVAPATGTTSTYRQPSTIITSTAAVTLSST